MRLQSAVWLAGIVSLVAGSVAGCGKDDEETAAGITGWAGPAPHIKARGSLNGDTIDFDVSGATAEDTAKVYCEREYVAPDLGGGAPDYANGSLVEFRIYGYFDTGVGERKMRLEFKKHNFQDDPDSTQTRIVPRVDTTVPGPTEMWLEWEWRSPDAASTKLYVGDAQEGHYRSGEFTGAVGADGLTIPDHTGTVGGYVTAKWSETESLDMTFTVKCTVNNVELQ